MRRQGLILNSGIAIVPQTTKVLFLTDSLGQPRLAPEPIYADQTWTYMLASRLAESPRPFRFYYHCFSGLDSRGVVEHLHGVLGAYCPDLVIVQVGIVDCYPRALRKTELSVISRLPVLGRWIHGIIRRHYSKIVRYRNITYVEPASFLDNHRAIKKHFSKAAMLVLPIAPPHSVFRARNPRIAEKIRLYNGFLQDVYRDEFAADIYDVDDVDSLYTGDHYHLSVFGHSVLCSQLERYVDNMVLV